MVRRRLEAVRLRADRPIRWAKRHVTTNRIRIGVVILFLLLAIWGIVLAHYELVIGHSWWALLLTTACTGVGPELAGIVIGVVTIDYLTERRQDEQLKEQLILQMGSRHNDVTDTAVRALKVRGWMYDGSLRRANLTNANLKGADLYDTSLEGVGVRDGSLEWERIRGANLQEAALVTANLEGAHLWGAKLERAHLVGTNLEFARLQNANLEGAHLWGANLAQAFLQDANLRGVGLMDASLEGANLRGANLERAIGYTLEQLSQAWTLEGATMPDGTTLRSEENAEGPTFEEWAASQIESQDQTIGQSVEEEIERALRGEEEE